EDLQSPERAVVPEQEDRRAGGRGVRAARAETPRGDERLARVEREDRAATAACGPVGDRAVGGRAVADRGIADRGITVGRVARDLERVALVHDHPRAAGEEQAPSLPR